jgi:hypothetical protein
MVHTNEWWSFRTSALTLVATYLNKWFFLESPFLLFYFLLICAISEIFCCCLATDRIF